MNGTTVHGTQYTDPARRRIPGTYYGTVGPAGDIFALEAQRPAANHVAVVGLGAGTLASYVDARTQMTFFEIDPVVIAVAEDPNAVQLPGRRSDQATRSWRAMRACRSRPNPRAHTTWSSSTPSRSDAIPIHLMTVEAIGEELRTLQPDGVIAFHISNRYYDLSPAIAAALDRLGLTTLERAGGPPMRDGGVDRHPEPLGGRLAGPGAARRSSKPSAGRVASPADHPFTDDYADLLTYLHIGF